MQEARVTLVPLKKAVVPVRVQHTDRIRAVARWSLARGRPVPVEHVALIIGAKLRWQDDDPLDHWTRAGVDQHLRGDVFNWCSEERVQVPKHLPESLWTYLHFLAEQGLFAPGSDPLARLLEPLRGYGGLGPDGTRR